MTDKEKLKELLDIVGHFNARKLRADAYLSEIKEESWSLGIVGINTNFDDCTIIPGKVFLERIPEPPGEIEIAGAIDQPQYLSAIARHSNLMTHQIVILKGDWSDKACIELGWWVVSLLRIKSLANFIVPAVSNYPWTALAAVGPKKCKVRLLEDKPSAKKVGEVVAIESSCIDWVSKYVSNFAKLVNVPSFSMAVDALTTYHFQSNSRMSIAMLWSGIEALFNIHSEISFRLAIYVAVVLEAPGPKRREIYQRVKKLYSIRSKAVHGASLSESKGDEHILDVRDILSRLICRYTEEGEVFSEERIECELFHL